MPQTLENLESLPQANVRDYRNPFPEDRYVKIPNVPIFCEHETTGPDGERQVFDRYTLKTLVDNGNSRIELSGDYAAVCVGHTKDPDEADQTQPEVIGAMGPFRLGLVGHPGTKQKYAILADLYIRRDKVDLYNASPRRSVELYYRDGKPQLIDPLALISEAPRLDLGWSPPIEAKGGDGDSAGLKYLYSANRHGMRVVKYAAAAYSGSGNVFTPSQYSAERKREMLEQQDVEQIVEAVRSLDVFQAMENFVALLPKLQEIIAKHDSELAADNQVPGTPVASPAHEAAETPTKETAEEAAVAPTSELPPENPPENPPEKKEEEVPQKFSLDENSSDEDVERYMSWRKAKKEKYAAGQPSDKVPAEKAKEILKDGEVHGKPLTEKQEGMFGAASGKDQYAKVQEQLNELRAQHSKTIDELRLGKLSELRKYRIFDVDKEGERCRYSKMNDDDFSSHVKDISENYRPTGVDLGMPIPQEILGTKSVADSMVPRPEKYSRENCAKAVKYCTDMADRGKVASYDAVLDNIANGREPDFKSA